MENGKDNANRLVERIVDDARRDADAELARARAEAARILARAKEEADLAEVEAQAKLEGLRAETLERAKLSAELEARKYALLKRREVLDEAFDRALTRLTALPDSERGAFMARIALAEADGGERIAPAERDAARIGALLDEINRGLAKRGAAPLTLAPPVENLQGGFKLIGKGYEKDCSFEALLKAARESLEGGAAKVLFE